ncbi:MAG: transposase [Gammaproteobacteria bacterium]|nr:transposase [Gammaproteobacteria bacterium]NIR82928.1 transposase [Gammaproteobacteria bacterium]NIR90197.1 transposase [Gammaproteobacteria bacterium]NIU04074.1 transposase [Gammaproteobacteria bacterium]NIV51063.1 IS3 family transposase [Gammaproteobacteria bacterium]
MRYGYPLIHTLLRREGFMANKKRIHRLYWLEGLHGRPKRPRRHASATHRERPERAAQTGDPQVSTTSHSTGSHGGTMLHNSTGS